MDTWKTLANFNIFRLQHLLHDMEEEEEMEGNAIVVLLSAEP